MLSWGHNTLTAPELSPRTSGQAFLKWYWAGHSYKNGKILITLQSTGVALWGTLIIMFINNNNDKWLLGSSLAQSPHETNRFCAATLA